MITFGQHINALSCFSFNLLEMHYFLYNFYILFMLNTLKPYFIIKLLLLYNFLLLVLPQLFWCAALFIHFLFYKLQLWSVPLSVLQFS